VQLEGRQAWALALGSHTYELFSTLLALVTLEGVAQVTPFGIFSSCLNSFLQTVGLWSLITGISFVPVGFSSLSGWDDTGGLI
jgi:hypothetical protein